MLSMVTPPHWMIDSLPQASWKGILILSWAGTVVLLIAVAVWLIAAHHKEEVWAAATIVVPFLVISGLITLVVGLTRGEANPHAQQVQVARYIDSQYGISVSPVVIRIPTSRSEADDNLIVTGMQDGHTVELVLTANEDGNLNVYELPARRN